MYILDMIFKTVLVGYIDIEGCLGGLFQPLSFTTTYSQLNSFCCCFAVDG